MRINCLFRSFGFALQLSSINSLVLKREHYVHSTSLAHRINIPTLLEDALCFSFTFDVLLSYSTSKRLKPSCARFSLNRRFKSK